MKSNNLCRYFDRYRTEETIKQNHQEIEQTARKLVEDLKQRRKYAFEATVSHSIGRKIRDGMYDAVTT